MLSHACSCVGVSVESIGESAWSVKSSNTSQKRSSMAAPSSSSRVFRDAELALEAGLLGILSRSWVSLRLGYVGER